MHRINLQDRATPREGTISFYWFENENIGLKRARFHRIQVEFDPIDTGCDYIEQPELPELTVEWIELDIDDPGRLAGVGICSKQHRTMEASIYIGAAHNPVDVLNMHLKEVAANRYEVDASLEIDFEFEGVAEREKLNLTFSAQYVGEL
jgi:hypothetical protein